MPVAGLEAECPVLAVAVQIAAVLPRPIVVIQVIGELFSERTRSIQLATLPTSVAGNLQANHLAKFNRSHDDCR